ncbi:acylneuraminate cytidylyltransferase family protein [Costertonia aggregata]|uniref:Acylneuraminate cytidylyltransferase family protein n=1 Tax=Costertonia aggregata TaxID=343403 RepID=A0A7H9AP61_9FLAO|nr:acylneuraminate cytidylyltransferase family protein [Costertonia aggregata]QLG45249.1 acylneuraminate cytidylyltransferase family protein [Costertonia aggregata]
MKITALLPMKGNSERVPNKNLKIFSGSPLYHKILNSLLASKHIDNVVINTDSKNISNDIANNYDERVIVIDRPKEIIGDHVSMNKVIEYDINQIDSDYYIQTHSTNPLLRTETIDNAIETMLKRKEKFDSIFSVTRMQTRLYGCDGTPLNHDPVKLIRTQDLPPIYEENSNMYIFSKESFKNSGGKRIGKNALMFEIDKIEAIDIDELHDFIMAESLYKILR